MIAVCELCQSDRLCALCRGKAPASPEGRISAAARRRILHVVAGTPARVSAEWNRLAREDQNPS